MPRQSTLVTLICKACGKPFETEPHQAARGRAFCSRACANDARRGADSPAWKGTPDQVCLHCGASFHVKASRIADGHGRYCSKKCAHLGRTRRAPLTCRACGASFEATASQVARNRAYCSVACGNTANQGAGNPAWKGIPDQTCLHCGKAFHVKPSRVAKGDGRYCSKECFYAGKRCKVERTCESCGTPFLTFPSTIARGQGRFCSSACWYKHFSTIRGADKWTWKGEDVTRPCAQCGEPFTVRPGLAREEQRFCSRKCAGKWMGERFVGETHWLWQGGHRYPRVNAHNRTAYKEWRKAVFTRDNFTCRDCGEHDKHLNAHHEKHWASHPDLRYDVANGTTLCPKCHRLRHKVLTRNLLR
jgi:hypothetical protein